MFEKYNLINNCEIDTGDIAMPKVMGNVAWEAFLKEVIEKEHWYSRYKQLSSIIEHLKSSSEEE